MHRVMEPEEEWKSVALTGLDVTMTVVIPSRRLSSGNFSANEFLRGAAGAAWGSYLNGQLRIALGKSIKVVIFLRLPSSSTLKSLASC